MATKTVYAVKNIMSNHLTEVFENASISMVLSLFEKCRISGAPVTNEEGKYVGVISKTDIFSSKLEEAMKDGATLNEIKVKDFMNTKSIITIGETDPADYAVELMLKNKIHRIFVTNKAGKLIGVVSSFDVMKLIKLEHGSEGLGSIFHFWNNGK